MSVSGRSSRPALAPGPAPSRGILFAVAGGLVAADTNSYFDKGYEFSTLKTFDFKTQRRISSDPIANNQLWSDDIRQQGTPTRR